ncbi:MAG: biotin/lipoyl-containing protein, partial [Aestuariivirga sp.]
MPNILMPALSPTMEEGKLAKWLKNVGDKVKSGDVLAEIETDKATMEVEAIDEGPLTAILVPAGTENVKVNTPIAVIGEADGPSPVADKPATPSPARGEGSKSLDQSPSPPAGEGGVRSTPGEGALSDPDIPEGTEMVAMTVREAIREAMSEEMRRDKDVFL